MKTFQKSINLRTSSEFLKKSVSNQAIKIKRKYFPSIHQACSQWIHSAIWHSFQFSWWLSLNCRLKNLRSVIRSQFYCFAEPIHSLMCAADFKYLWKHAKERQKLSPVKRFIWFSRNSGLICVWCTFRYRLVTTVLDNSSDSHHYRIKYWCDLFKIIEITAVECKTCENL